MTSFTSSTPIMLLLKATRPRYNEWPDLHRVLIRAELPTSERGPLVHYALHLMATMSTGSSAEWDLLLTEVERELNDRAMTYQGRMSPWDEA